MTEIDALDCLETLDSRIAEIDVPFLLERILTKREEAMRRGAKDIVIVVTQEEATAIEFAYKKAMAGGGVPDRTVKVWTLAAVHPSQRKLNAPYREFSLFGHDVIGSDFVGELSPMIL